MATQSSVISYAPQPYFSSGAATIVGYSNVSSIENTDGIFDPNLSNYTTIVPNSSAADFGVQIDFNKQSGHLADSNMSLGFIGCAMLTYADSGGSPDLSTEFSENVVCLMSCNIGTVSDELVSYAHNSQDNIHTFAQAAMPSIISGGRSNVLFSGLGLSSAGSTGTVYATFERAAADVSARPHVRLIIGHLFIGVDVPITIDPRSFTWTLALENERFKARDYGAINSDGTLVRRSTGEIIKIDQNQFVGSQVTAVTPEIISDTVPNLFDLIKANTSYPILLNPYPRNQVTQASLTVEEANYTARQNFFSIYGFMNDPIELANGEFRDGLQSEYRARFRIEETR